jgi:hypothetical protein
MEKEAASYKIKPDTDYKALLKHLSSQSQHNIKCSDLVKMIFDIFDVIFDDRSFEISLSTKNHLKFYDPVTSETQTFSCHYLSKTDKFNPSGITRLTRMLNNSFEARENLKPTASTSKWRVVESNLDEWFDQEWEDLRRPKKDGGYEDCGRTDTSKGKKPVCVPKNKAKSLDKNEIENRKRQKAKEEKKPNPDKKPNRTNYTDEAGGKSKKSQSNIRFVGSMINFQAVDPKMIRQALMGEEFEEKSLDHSVAPEGIPKDPMKTRQEKVMEEAESNPKVFNLVKDTLDSLFTHFIRFSDHYAHNYGFDNGDQAVESVMENDSISPNKELYLAYIGYLKTDALKDLDPKSLRYKILSVVLQIAPEHNIFNSVSAMPILYGIAAKFKDEFTD